MIVGAGDHVDAEPFQIIEQLGVGGHECALGDPRRAFVPAVHGAFKVSDGGVGAAQNFS